MKTLIARLWGRTIWRALFGGTIALGFVIIMGLLLLLNGYIWFVDPEVLGYRIKGVDVSRYQGHIDWQEIAAQDIQFAFIKATEGSGYQDPGFAYNYGQAQEAGLQAAAYHFFSFESPGLTQANNFLQTVPLPGDARVRSQLPHVIDLELYGDFRIHKPEAARVLPELHDLVNAIENAYGRKPIFYTTYSAYHYYLKDDFGDCGIWIRDLRKKPELPDGKNWVFWQYCDRGRLRGFNGKERFIDLNIFNGQQSQWEEYIQKQAD